MPEITPFSNLTPEEISRYRDAANWLVHFPDGTTRGDWTKIEDPGYRVRVEHDHIIWGKDPFDKINFMGWGAFILPMRVSNGGIAEFCLNRERRILLRDGLNQQGDVFIHNIPQGAIEPGESTLEASIRECEQETGVKPTDLLNIGRLGFDIANSESLQDIFLGLVPYTTVHKDTQLDATEDLSWKWHTWEDIQALDLVDSKTESALYKAARVLRPELLIPHLAGRFRLTGVSELSHQESLEWYIKPEMYAKLRENTTPNYPHTPANL